MRKNKQRHRERRRRTRIERQRAKRKPKGRTRAKSAPPTPLTRRVLAAHDDRIRTKTEAKQRIRRRAKIDKDRTIRKTIAGNK